ncbi:MAG: carboxyl transferase domain-containing protein [Dehalococcoidales bacterium]|nr:carboxyl transferase domain-containing protein [Dehalococcoidales bacterium]
MGLKDDIRDLEARRERAKEMGGKERVAKQHARSRLTARERVAKLVDPGSFVELGILARAYGSDLKELSAADGRVCGTATINGRMVAINAHDRTILGGSGGIVGHRKTNMMDAIAVKGEYPFITLADESGGIRIQETMGSENWAPGDREHLTIARDLRRVPRIVAIMGECFGEPSWHAAFADYVPMVKGTAMGAAGPKMIEWAIGQKITPHELAGWEIQARLTGQADSFVENDEECLEIIKEFLSYMPSHCDEEPPYIPPKDDPYRKLDITLLEKTVPSQLNRSYDMFRLIKLIVDDGKYFPLKKDFGPALVTCLARIGGRVVGIYASNPMFNAGAPDIQACEKAADFICFCDSWNIPLICLMDIPGMFPGRDVERQKLVTKIMVWEQAQGLATVPQIQIAIRKDYAMGAAVMGGKGDVVNVAWPSAQMSFVDPDVGIELAMAARIADAKDKDAERARIRAEWSEKSAPWGAAANYGVCDVIDPTDTRRFIFQALQAIRGTREKVIGEHKMQDWPGGF